MATDIADDLRRAVAGALDHLHAIPAETAARRPAPGKWAPAEIIGHLIDSASNNHGRFVRARFRDDLRFGGYDQDAWVDAQGYRRAHWPDLLDLWCALNLHIARVMETTPPGILDAPRADHDLDRIAWEVVPADQPVTLAYFMRDYIAHLRHHLRQIDTAFADPPGRQSAAGTIRTD